MVRCKNCDVGWNAITLIFFLPQPAELLEWPCCRGGRRAWVRAVCGGWWISLCRGRNAGGSRPPRAASSSVGEHDARFSPGHVYACAYVWPSQFRSSLNRKNILSISPLYALDSSFRNQFCWSVQEISRIKSSWHGFPLESFLEVRLQIKFQLCNDNSFVSLNDHYDFKLY